MKIKVSELTKIALNWAVANAINKPVRIEGRLIICGRDEIEGTALFHPGTNWMQGGMLIESEGITLYQVWKPDEDGRNALWRATIGAYLTSGLDGPVLEGKCTQDGPTPLIAAMRCIVEYSLGAEVEIPEELL